MTESVKSANLLQPSEAFGQYRIIRLLGRGGMGEVYEAEHSTLGLSFALKLLPAEFAAQAGALERFRREARVMAQLHHPNIIRVDEFGECEGRYWLRMELADGLDSADGAGKRIISLSDYAAQQGGKIPQTEMVGILRHILEGLSYAHRHGAIHRDLKPANILFARLRVRNSPEDVMDQVQVKISDFGLVRLVGEEWIRSQVQLSVQRSMSMGDQVTMAGDAEGTSTRSMLGTYEYMSPEQKRGEDADARSDIYSLGLMTYKLLTGRELGVKLPSKIDPALVAAWDDIVSEATETHHGDRMASCSRFLELLSLAESQIAASQVVAVPAVMAPPPIPLKSDSNDDVAGSKERRGGWGWLKTRSLVIKMLLATAVLVVLGTVAFLLWPKKATPKVSEENTLVMTGGVSPEVAQKVKSTPAVPQPKEENPFEQGISGKANLPAAPVASVVPKVMSTPTVPQPKEENPFEQDISGKANLSATPVALAQPVAPPVAVGFPRQPKHRSVDLGDGVGMELVWVPAGDFMMGADDSADSKPKHHVRLTHGFWMGRTEVTQGQWEKVMGNNPSTEIDATLPVDGVSWEDCQSFFKELNALQGAGTYVFRLPTEAEWEYACRAGATNQGDAEPQLGRMAWFQDNSNRAAHPVATLVPNAWGLYDMYGNVWEWCQDWYGTYEAGEVTGPTGPSSGRERIMRGGSWKSASRMCGAAHRGWGQPNVSCASVGLRVVAQETVAE